MRLVVKVTAPEGDVAYLGPPDREGLRFLSPSIDGADVFSSYESAEYAVEFMRTVVGPAHRFEIVRLPTY